jgi:hypothetical protein
MMAFPPERQWLVTRAARGGSVEGGRTQTNSSTCPTFGCILNRASARFARRRLMSRDRDASRKVFGHPEKERLHELRHAVVIDLFDHHAVGRPGLIAR